MAGRFTRREFIRGAGLAAGATVLAAIDGKNKAQAADPISTLPVVPAPNTAAYFPIIKSIYPVVTHVHSANATNWQFDSSWYGLAVNQTVINSMIETGLYKLTNQTNLVSVWKELMPGYIAGKKIAVKINLNNASKEDADNAIDALPQMVNALIRALVLGGVQEQDVWVYDARRPMPKRIWDRLTYKNAGYYDNGGGYAPNTATCNGSNASLKVDFDSRMGMTTTRYLADLLFTASYVINMPILKRHSTHPVTLGFKNHFGSLSNLGGSGADNPHPHIEPGDTTNYSPTYSPLVDINANPNINNKTVLTIGDGLFGASNVGAAPQRWPLTFANKSPNSILFSRDRVAIDCVMVDLLRSEWGLDHGDAAYDYLKLAASQGLGCYERGEPHGAGYSTIAYCKIEI